MLHKYLLDGQKKMAVLTPPVLSIPHDCCNNTEQENMDQYAFKILIHLSVQCGLIIINLVR